MNIELLRKVCKATLEDYKHFTMTVFKHTVRPFEKKCVTEYKRMDCGTVACLAGRTVIEAKGMDALKRMRYGQIEGAAASLLDLSPDQTSDLFLPYESRIYPGLGSYTPGTREYARYVVRQVKKFVKDETGVSL